MGGGQRVGSGGEASEVLSWVFIVRRSAFLIVKGTEKKDRYKVEVFRPRDINNLLRGFQGTKGGREMGWEGVKKKGRLSR